MFPTVHRVSVVGVNTPPFWVRTTFEECYVTPFR